MIKWFCIDKVDIVTAIHKIFYTFFGIGYIKYASGTAASVFATVLIYILHLFLKQNIWLVLAFTFIFIVVIFNYLNNRFEVFWNNNDPKFVVIDEVLGVFLYNLLLNNIKLKLLIISLVLFRFFDINKPYPLRNLQNINNVNSVILDDIGAAIYTYLIMILVIKFLKF